ncbi:histidinol-phosphatase [Rhodoferax sp.]|uniref:histidinol-phosphatase n=1 Tax=Rhodoferax sp. TaxID=50421 RepID=UPI002607FF88|nr:histidinol-phosphatase [Rhodoferax sp.]MDD2923721.1 histidinol-phosphatase [Rhodoferax sp.]
MPTIQTELHDSALAPIPTSELEKLLQIANNLADVARQNTLPLFRTPLEVIAKLDDSPVTVADRATEASMRGLLNTQVPGHGILGEEHGRERMDAEYLWVLDPIDGTKSFITGSPLWGTLIGLLHQGRPLLGLVDMPVLGERWLALRGQAAQCNGRPVRASTCQNLAQARVYTTSPDAFGAADWAAFDTLSRTCALRRFGGDCYSYAQLAGGYIDLVVEAGLQPYDYLAVVSLVQAAGGVMTDWDGQPLGVASDGRVVAAATPALHAQALAALSAAKLG